MVYILSQKEIPGALIPAIIARSFVQGFYKDKSFTQRQRLIDEGIRLVTKKGFQSQPEKKAKRYGAMLKKWNLA